MNSISSFHKHAAAVLSLQPGDRIVAFEPYHYGGKPKKQPETPAIVQSIYANGQFVSYMRLDSNGNLTENGNRPVEDPSTRLADAADLKQFHQQFSVLEAKFRERTGQELPAGIRISPQERPIRSLRKSLLHAQFLAARLMGPHARTYPAQMESGTYRGEIIGESDFHLIQKLNDRSAVLHMKHMLNWTAPRGTRVWIRYQGSHFARVIDLARYESGN
jgi:hypothetical protein